MMVERLSFHLIRWWLLIPDSKLTNSTLGYC
ncbi:hypothetical protein T09_2364, partial [Trichinella sp. T9]